MTLLQKFIKKINECTFLKQSNKKKRVTRDTFVVVPESILKDCTELFAENKTLKSGHYNISPDRKVVISAYCNMTAEEGWTVNISL